MPQPGGLLGKRQSLIHTQHASKTPAFEATNLHSEEAADAQQPLAQAPL